MAINRIRKGNKGEREAAKAITKWSGKEHRKVPRSGGLGWRTANTSGDIVCIVEGHFSPFCFEIKSYASIDFYEVMIPGRKGIKLMDWWMQASGDAGAVKKIPVLMCRQNGMSRGHYFVGIPNSLYLQIKDHLPENHHYLITKLGGNRVSFLYSQELFSTDYKVVRKIAKQYAKERL